jgi:hypothetical protein
LCCAPTTIAAGDGPIDVTITVAVPATLFARFTAAGFTEHVEPIGSPPVFAQDSITVLLKLLSGMIFSVVVPV